MTMDSSEATAIIAATVVGTIAGVGGTGMGGAMALQFRCLSTRAYSVILGFSAGVMISVVAFDLMPEAIQLGGLAVAIGGVVAGVILVSLLDLLPHTHFMASDAESSRFYKTGVIVGLGIAMHNLPEGLAIGAGYAHDVTLGLGLALVIAVHNFPEGMAMACPMIIGGVRPVRVVLSTMAAGMPMAAGALLGSAVGSVSPILLAVCLGFAGGAMLFVTCDELIPDAQELSTGHSGSFGIIAGVIFGILLTSLLRA